MGVLRGGPGKSQSEVALYNQTNGLHSPWSVYTLRTFACRSSTDPVVWWVRPCQSVFLLINIIFLLFLI
jgi:hypothetical protein